MENFKGAIFDLDGTLLDSMSLWHKVDIAFFENRKMAIPEGYIQAISPMGTYNAAVYTKETYNIKESIEEIIDEWRVIAKKEYSEHVKLKNGAKEYLLRLKEKGVKLAVATASDKDLFELFIKLYNKFAHHIDSITSHWELDDEKREKLKSIYAKDVASFFNKSQTISAFGAAVATPATNASIAKSAIIFFIV